MTSEMSELMLPSPCSILREEDASPEVANDPYLPEEDILPSEEIVTEQRAHFQNFYRNSQPPLLDTLGWLNIQSTPSFVRQSVQRDAGAELFEENESLRAEQGQQRAPDATSQDSFRLGTSLLSGFFFLGTSGMPL